MEWSASSATKAYLDALHLCKDQKRRCESWRIQEPGSNEFISALAAGTKAKLIVEVTSGASPSTIALATAARQTAGSRFVCILPENALAEAKKVVKDLGLKDIVDFKTGDPSEILRGFENIDFTLVDCKDDKYTNLLKQLDVNPRKAVVVANNLVGEKKGLGGHCRGMKDHKIAVRSMKHPIGKGMEVTMIGKTNKIEKTNPFGTEKKGISMKKSTSGKSKWIVKVDEESGEEHIFRVPRSL